MIPAVVPPLTSLSVLVTRPAPQAASLAASITALGGDAIVFPSIAIEPLHDLSPADSHDMIIFVSTHAVEYGATLITKSTTTRIAAIGKATAAALVAANLSADIVPPAAFTSEALLGHPELGLAVGQRVLIVRGAGGRELLRESLAAQGLTVNTLEVYRRVKPTLSAAEVAALEARWIELGIDVVTATSVETYANLSELLSDTGRALLKQTALLAPSQRIIDAARADGWNGEALVSGGADDTSLLRVLSRWHARARIG